MITWLRNLWWERQRASDLVILWPICKERAASLDQAKAAFMVHAMNSPCWVRHYGEDLWRTIDALG